MLTSHPDVVIPPECGFIIWLYPKYDSWSECDTDSRSRVNHFIGDLLECRKFDTWRLSAQEIRNGIALHGPADFASLCEAVYLCYGNTKNWTGKLWGDKNNFYVGHLPTLHDIYPSARFVHIVRDLRDVACSYRAVMGLNVESPYRPQLPIGLTEIATTWSDNLRKVGDALQFLPASASLTLRYEDLIQEPSRCLQALCDWLGIEYSERMLRYHQLNREQELEPPETRGWKEKTLLPLDVDNIGKFRRQLDESDIALLEDVGQRGLRKFGYL